MSSYELYITIAVIAGVNFFTRVFPFLFFMKKEPPSSIIYIEKYFPAVIMVILVFYTLKDIDFAKEFAGYKEIGSIAFTAALHIFLKNYLISIFSGTIFYMVLVQYF